MLWKNVIEPFYKRTFSIFFQLYGNFKDFIYFFCSKKEIIKSCYSTYN